MVAPKPTSFSRLPERLARFSGDCSVFTHVSVSPFPFCSSQWSRSRLHPGEQGLNLALKACGESHVGEAKPPAH